MTERTWTYEGRIVNSIEDFPENTYGFIYEVKHEPTGLLYIGKKVLYFERKKKLGKRALEALKEERKAAGIGGRVPTSIIERKESDWKSYYGSHETIKKLLKEGATSHDFERRIVHLCKSKKELTYFECKYLFIREVLEDRNNYINDNILGKFYRKDFNHD